MYRHGKTVNKVTNSLAVTPGDMSGRRKVHSVINKEHYDVVKNQTNLLYSTAISIASMRAVTVLSTTLSGKFEYCKQNCVTASSNNF